MKSRKLRVVIPLAIGLLATVCFIFGQSFGNLCAVGWKGISLLCPLGALSSMLASKTFIPKAAISLAVGLLLMLALGRFFCGWVCPVPLLNKLPSLFKGKKKGPCENEAAERRCTSCSSCEGKALDSRHFVLVGALLSATVFGFPVFCLICPIGLSFATIFLIVALFAGGDITWSLVVAPALLLLEVTLFKKWCSKICPLGALMSLMAKLSKRTLRVTVDSSKCLEASGASCGRCEAACPEGINPRSIEDGLNLSECTKCRACVETCPAKAISLPLVARKPKEEERVD